MEEFRQKIRQRFDTIYRKQYDSAVVDKLVDQINTTKNTLAKKFTKWSEQDVILITYGDSIHSSDKSHLQSLDNFIETHLKDIFSIIHILPFFPYSSDDGFSVIDYRTVNPELGTWQDIHEFAAKRRIMSDLVINHISQESQWFRNFLSGIEPGKSYFIETNPAIDLSKVVRPRSSPLLTSYETTQGIKHVWTTFSADQIDLNFANPQVLSEMMNIFLFYLLQGVSVIRLDAVAYLWKEIGTVCIHRPETHEVVKLIRDIMDYIDPSLILITETNVPNTENLSYFGNNDEAHVVYNFTLPPMLLHCMYSGDSTLLSHWASSLPELPANCSFLNFTASHDGIGVRPLEGILSHEQLTELVNGIKQSGGFVNTRRNNDGKDVPYELNITYLDSLMSTREGMDEYQADRFLCSQTIMCSLKGIPAVYINSILGGKNYTEGVKQTGMNRTINRQKWDSVILQEDLLTDALRSKIIKAYRHMLQVRKITPEFHPNTDQEIQFLRKTLFIIKRAKNALISVSNISKTDQVIQISAILKDNKHLIDILSGERVEDEIRLKPYQTVWLKEISPAATQEKTLL